MTTRPDPPARGDHEAPLSRATLAAVIVAGAALIWYGVGERDQVDPRRSAEVVMATGMLFVVAGGAGLVGRSGPAGDGTVAILRSLVLGAMALLVWTVRAASHDETLMIGPLRFRGPWVDSAGRAFLGAIALALTALAIGGAAHAVWSRRRGTGSGSSGRQDSPPPPRPEPKSGPPQPLSVD